MDILGGRKYDRTQQHHSASPSRAGTTTGPCHSESPVANRPTARAQVLAGPEGLVSQHRLFRNIAA